MCVSSLNEICESIFELSRTQVKMCGSRVTHMKPVYPRLSSEIQGKELKSIEMLKNIHTCTFVYFNI